MTSHAPDGHRHLVEALDEARRTVDRVTVVMTGRAEYELKLGGHVREDGAVRLASDVTVLTDSLVERHMGEVRWSGGHETSDRRVVRFTVGGRATRIEWDPRGRRFRP